MILERFYNDKLAQASYLVGCPATGEALVIDPNRDVAPYLSAADRHEVQITHVTETHIHADFASGLREVAEGSGARALLSDEGGEDWKYAFAGAIDAVLLKDGDGFNVGNIKVEVLHTPGHTPEHLSFMITDTAATDRPMGVFTGDFAFVGAVGRPDLLEKAANIKGTMESSARQLFKSLQRFKELPDYLQIWPGHGAGSACGKALGAVPQSTLGYERLASPAFALSDEDEFVRWILDGQPMSPAYFGEMKRMNKMGPPILGGLRKPPQTSDAKLRQLALEGAFVVDARPWPDYAAGHIKGTINIPLGLSFINWAGWFVPYDREFYLILDEARGEGEVHEAVRDLALIGLDRVAGYLSTNTAALRGAGSNHLEAIEEVGPEEAHRSLEAGGATVIDVRAPDEWAAGHLPGVANIPLGTVPARMKEIPTDRPIVLQCRTGERSAIAASLMQAAGIENVKNLVGGFRRWSSEGYPVER